MVYLILVSGNENEFHSSLLVFTYQKYNGMRRILGGIHKFENEKWESHSNKEGEHENEK